MEDEDPILRRERLLRGNRPSQERGFRNPFARDPHGFLTPPEEAEPGVVYLCPNETCPSPRLVFVPTGPNIPHSFFRHQGEPGEGCSGETAIHAQARERVSDLAILGRLAFVVPRACDRCGELDQQARARVEFRADKAPHKESEVHIPGTTRRGDVLLIVGCDITLVVEIRKSNAVSEEKAAEMPLPWVEIQADDVVRNCPSGPFATLNGDLFDATPTIKSCWMCDARDAEAARRARAEQDRLARVKEAEERAKEQERVRALQAEETRKVVEAMRARQEQSAREAIEKEKARKAAVEADRVARVRWEEEHAEQFARERAEREVAWEKRKKREAEDRDDRELRSLFLSDILRDLGTLADDRAKTNLDALYHAIGRSRARIKGGPGIKVHTPNGTGKLWQVFHDRVGVDIAGRVHFFHPNCVRLTPESDALEMLS